VKQSPLKAAILDWAGTVVDHGNRAPVSAFVGAFARFGVVVTAAEARGPMGLGKVDHIRAIGRTASVASGWRARYLGESDVTEIFQVFEPINAATVHDHADIIPGAIAAINALRGRGLRIAGTTGYTRQIMDVLEPLAAASGYAPELTV
jgi:phosphonoacetaldehyde hydrolase